MSRQYSKRPNGSSCCNGCSKMLQHPIPCKDSLKAGRGNSEPSFIEHIMSFQPKCHALCWGQVMKATESHTQNSQNIPKLCCCPDCSNLYLIPMEHLPEASGHHLMHNRVASSQQHHLPQGDHPPTMLERSRRYAYTWTRSLYKLPVSITSFIFSLCASIASTVILMIYIYTIYDCDMLYMIIISYILCVFETMFAKSLSITSHVL